MTEFWKSNPMHWCDVCKCWMNDTKAARQNHERGMGHKAALERKIRDMTRKADQEKRDKERTTSALNRIEDQAQKRFLEDQAEMEAAAGTWVWDVSATYYYNEKFRWYYDPETKWYYGGEPTEWTQTPPIPGHALFGTAKHVGGPIQQPSQPTSTGAGTAPSTSGRPATATAAAAPSRPLSASIATAAAAANAAAAGAKEVTVQKKVIALPSHPLMAAGGHRGPEMGRVGAAKRVGLQGGQAAGAVAAKPGAAAPGAGDKRKREGEKEMSAEEKAFQAKREAARARVQQRTAQQFGYL